jgi:tetratricopeptide (TPR) repeat protein
MATKAKSSGTSVITPAESLEGKLTEALVLLEKSNAAEARVLLVDVQAQALEAGHLSMARTARCYLAAMDARQAPEAREMGTAAARAILCLNRKETPDALALLDQALAAEPGKASHHYLRAVALAQLEQPAEAAEALAKAIQLDPDLVFQFRMDNDFDAIRHSAPFAALERG